MPERRDHTIDNQLGPRTETRQVGYYPDDHDRLPGVKSGWNMLCDIPRARGPFIEFRIVNYGPWEAAPGQEDSNG